MTSEEKVEVFKWLRNICIVSDCPPAKLECYECPIGKAEKEYKEAIENDN